MASPTLKPCMQHQPMLFPPSVEELIPESALVRVVDSIAGGKADSRYLYHLAKTENDFYRICTSQPGQRKRNRQSLYLPAV